MIKGKKISTKKTIGYQRWYTNQQGQSLIEYAVFMIILVAAFFITSTYVKRSIQGRWKTAVDDFGDQYDPATTNGLINHVITTGSNSVVEIIPDGAGYWTQRIDTSLTNEITTGTVTN